MCCDDRLPRPGLAFRQADLTSSSSTMTNLNDGPNLRRPVQFQLQPQHRQLQPLLVPPLVPPEAQHFRHTSPTRQSLLSPDPRLIMPRMPHPTGLSAKIRH